MGTQDLNPAASTQVGTGEGGQPIYEGNLNDRSPGSDDASAGGSSADDGSPSEADSTPPDDGSSGTGEDDAAAPVDTGDATFVGAESAPDPNVIPIAGDSADDPNLGEGGDPAGSDTGDATFANLPAGGPPSLPPFDPESGSGPVSYPPSSDPGAGLPPPPLPPGFVIRDGHVVREERPPHDPLDGGLPPPPLPKGFVIRDGTVQRAGSTQAPASPRPGWLIPAVVAGVLVLGTVGFAATRGNTSGAAATLVPTASLAAPTAAPTATIAGTKAPTVAPVSTVRVTDTRIDSTGNACLDHTTLSVTVQVVGANPGDVVVFALSGPGLPSTVSAVLDAKGVATATMGSVGPVKGTNTWTVGVQSIGGVPYPGGQLPQIAFCPNN